MLRENRQGRHRSGIFISRKRECRSDGQSSILLKHFITFLIDLANGIIDSYWDKSKTEQGKLFKKLVFLHISENKEYGDLNWKNLLENNYSYVLQYPQNKRYKRIKFKIQNLKDFEINVSEPKSPKKRVFKVKGSKSTPDAKSNEKLIYKLENGAFIRLPYPLESNVNRVVFNTATILNKKIEKIFDFPISFFYKNVYFREDLKGNKGRNHMKLDENDENEPEISLKNIMIFNDLIKRKNILEKERKLLEFIGDGILRGIEERLTNNGC